MAQISMGGGGAPQPQARTPDIAPPAVPGAGAGAPLATGPKMQQPASGDPTAALFTAINKGDYSGAQDALGRGADLNAKNQFGETPLDLSISLNRNTITFLLLQTRNEMGGMSGPVGPTWTLGNPAPAPVHKGKTKEANPAPAPHAVAPKPVPHHAAPAAIGNKGTPNPQAGFLGFDPKN
ncbi:ankyrin repeat domain-containing protein [Acidocella aromatica]|uniref:Ankyrin repeat domain-containing protein n=1 Tax=Acidocella aromatica TaxID=1303579 RepID=A0A840VDE4_9PROT|nr:ankyrin repeat domain-containing protein [Acidocella aromatica]MBB5373724.1 hypothetical protein [Acidocella aromatica]